MKTNLKKQNWYWCLLYLISHFECEGHSAKHAYCIFSTSVLHKVHSFPLNLLLNHHIFFQVVNNGLLIHLRFYYNFTTTPFWRKWRSCAINNVPSPRRIGPIKKVEMWDSSRACGDGDGGLEGTHRELPLWRSHTAPGWPHCPWAKHTQQVILVATVNEAVLWAVKPKKRVIRPCLCLRDPVQTVQHA